MELVNKHGIMDGKTVLVNESGIICGKKCTGLYTWDYECEDWYWSINMVLWMRRMVLVNKHGIMYGKNGTGQ